MTEPIIHFVYGPWRLDREDRCWVRWVMSSTDGIVHVRRVWLPEPAHFREGQSDG